MVKPDWKDAPEAAEAFGPKTKGYKACWYRTSLMGKWYFMEVERPWSGWLMMMPPTKHRYRQLERRP